MFIMQVFHYKIIITIQSLDHHKQLASLHLAFLFLLRNPSISLTILFQQISAELLMQALMLTA